MPRSIKRETILATGDTAVDILLTAIQHLEPVEEQLPAFRAD